MLVRTINLSPSELHAIEDHKYFLSQQRGREVTIEESIEDFLQRFAESWRKEKARRDILDQRAEIERHRHCRSQELGHDVGSAAAAREWCERYACIWREERESLERNGFLHRRIVVRNPRCLHLRPWSAIALRAASFSCDAYVHRRDMTYWNLTLAGVPYMNVKSVIGMLSLGFSLGQELEFIATGRQAAEALDALRDLLESDAPVQPPITLPTRH